MGNGGIVGWLADRVMKNGAFKSRLDEAWQVHMNVFGPILEHAFEGDDAMRIELTAALNMLSRADFAGSLGKLAHIGKKVRTDADKAAFWFFTAFALDASGQADSAKILYMQSLEVEKDFHMTHTKLGKIAYAQGIYDMALDCFANAKRCIEENWHGGQPEKERALGAAHLNLSGCRMMLHDLAGAKEECKRSEELAPKIGGRAGIKALMCALEGDGKQAQEQLRLVKNEMPAAYDELSRQVGMILEKKHPHFYEAPVEDGKIAGFWQAFEREEKEFCQLADEERNDEFARKMNELLKPVLGHIRERGFDCSCGKNGGMYGMVLPDFYSVGLRAGYERLIEMCPGEIAKRWEIQIEH